MRKTRLLLATGALSSATLLSACSRERSPPGNGKGSVYDAPPPPANPKGSYYDGGLASDAEATDAAPSTDVRKKP
jgi:hypothetical protein